MIDYFRRKFRKMVEFSLSLLMPKRVSEVTLFHSDVVAYCCYWVKSLILLEFFVIYCRGALRISEPSAAEWIRCHAAEWAFASFLLFLLLARMELKDHIKQTTLAMDSVTHLGIPNVILLACFWFWILDAPYDLDWCTLVKPLFSYFIKLMQIIVFFLKKKKRKCG